jgi:hypothetical protein
MEKRKQLEKICCIALLLVILLAMVSPVTAISASTDSDLLNYLDTLIDPANSEYFNTSWQISKDQYKIMIAALIWGEGNKAGYTAHSIYVDKSGIKGKGDCLDHSDPHLYNKFWFSSGIGPLQVDRRGLTSDLWSYWPTIKKLDYRGCCLIQNSSWY